MFHFLGFSQELNSTNDSLVYKVRGVYPCHHQEQEVGGGHKAIHDDATAAKVHPPWW